MANEPQEMTPQTEAAAPEAPAPARRSTPTGAAGVTQYNGLGRRKTAVARVILRPGEGRWTVNGRTLEEYFPRPVLRQAITQPLALTDTQGRFDILVNVDGGGPHGQADAVRLGIARALVKMDEAHRSRLRGEELLTRDAREVERKKPGRPKARKRFQFSKR